MFTDIVERVFYELYADEPDNEETMFYYDTLYENIKLFADPKYNGDDVENHFYGIICGLCRAGEIQAFKRGLSFALQLSADCAKLHSRTKCRTQDEYEEQYSKEAKYAKELRAALKSEATV